MPSFPPYSHPYVIAYPHNYCLCTCTAKLQELVSSTTQGLHNAITFTYPFFSTKYRSRPICWRYAELSQLLSGKECNIHSPTACTQTTIASQSMHIAYAYDTRYLLKTSNLFLASHIPQIILQAFFLKISWFSMTIKMEKAFPDFQSEW